MTKGLTLSRRAAERCQRLCWVTGVVSLLAALCLVLLTNEGPTERVELAKALQKETIPPPFQFAPFDKYAVPGDSLFNYTDPPAAPYSFKKQQGHDAEAEAEAAQKSSGPDLSGLRLVATLPGLREAWAILEETPGRKQVLVPLGGKLRGAFLSAIAPESVEFSTGAGVAVLPLWKSWSEPPGAHSNRASPAGLSRRVAAPVAEAPAPIVAASRSQGRRLGVSVRYYKPGESFAGGQGLYITDVLRSGLDVRPGDILLKVDGANVSNIGLLAEYLHTTKSDRVRLTLLRNGETKEVEVPFYE